MGRYKFMVWKRISKDDLKSLGSILERNKNGVIYFGENLYPNDFKCSTNSVVVNTSTINCSLKCESSDQIGVLFVDKDRARYSVSSLSEISSLALVRNMSNCPFGTSVILFLNISINSLKSSEERSDNSSTSDLCSPSSSKIYSGAYSSTTSEKIISLVTPLPVNALNNSVASIINFMNVYYFNSGYNFLYLSCNDLFTFLPNFTASSSVNLDFDISLSNLLYCSSLDFNSSLFTNSSTAFAKANSSLAFNFWGILTLIVISSILSGINNKYINFSFGNLSECYDDIENSDSCVSKNGVILSIENSGNYATFRPEFSNGQFVHISTYLNVSERFLGGENES